MLKLVKGCKKAVAVVLSVMSMASATSALDINEGVRHLQEAMRNINIAPIVNEDNLDYVRDVFMDVIERDVTAELTTNGGTQMGILQEILRRLDSGYPTLVEDARSLARLYDLCALEYLLVLAAAENLDNENV